MIDLSLLDIRYTYVTDVSYLRKWMEAPGILDFFLMKTEKEIEDVLRVWMGFCRFSCSLTATFHHVPCGIATLFLMPYKKIAHQALFKIIVDPQWQRKGIGTMLLRNLKHLAKQYFHLEMLAIEIVEGNPLAKMLFSHGFVEIFRQEKFVKDYGEYRARICFEAVL